LSDAAETIKKLEAMQVGAVQPSPNSLLQFIEFFSEGSAASYAVIIFLIFFLLCLVLIPINIYFAQRHARLCRDELRQQTVILKSIQTARRVNPPGNAYDKEM